jgi:hypothetical protein
MATWPPLLPLCHDWIRVVALSPPFPPYKYCRMCVASRWSSTLLGVCVSIWQIWRDKEFLSLISGKIEWESPPSILVTRNPNWS